MGDTIRERMPRRCAGFVPWKAFAHKAKVRAKAGAGDQGTRMGSWGPANGVNGRVDVARVNWPGLVGVQISSGTYDARPRLVKANR